MKSKFNDTKKASNAKTSQIADLTQDEIDMVSGGMTLSSLHWGQSSSIGGGMIYTNPKFHQRNGFFSPPPPPFGQPFISLSGERKEGEGGNGKHSTGSRSNADGDGSFGNNDTSRYTGNDCDSDGVVKSMGEGAVIGGSAGSLGGPKGAAAGAVGGAVGGGVGPHPRSIGDG